MRALVRWLLARRLGSGAAARFLEELDELHAVKRDSEGPEAGDRWVRRELRFALWNALGPRVGEAVREQADGGQRPPRGAWIPSLLRDLRFGLRTLRSRPLFTVLVVGTLGLGIGASTTVFSLVDGILLRDMAYERPGELVTIWGTYPEWRDDPLLQEAWDKIGLTWDDYTTLRDQTRAYSGVGGHRSGTLTLTGVGDPIRLESGEATATLFSLLGIRPHLGRTFLPGEDGPGAPRLAVLGYDLWQTRFGADSTVVGRSVILNGKPFQVIGVLPRGVRVHSTLYNLFTAAIDTGERAVWVPANWNPEQGYGSRDLETLGRLRPGVTTERALAEVGTILKSTGRHQQTVFRLTPPLEEVVAGFRSPLLLLLGASGLLLLIACGNAATLLVGEAIERRGEISTRVALGAGRRRIAQQLLTESLILGLVGSLVGMILTPVGVRTFLALGPSLPRLQNVEVNQGVLLSAALTGVLCALCFGFVPAFLQHRKSIHAALQRDGRGRFGGGGKGQAALLAGELALTMVLLVTAGLLSRSLGELTRVDPGFRPDGIATVRTQIPSDHFGAEREVRREGVGRFRRQVLERVRALPGVLQAGTIDGLPFPGVLSGQTFTIGGTDPSGREQVTARDHAVSPGYFQAMGIPILAGRDLEDADGVEEGENVAVINETMARRFWADGSPLGDIVGNGGKSYRIVGVVGDVRERHLGEPPLPMIYRPASISGGSFSIVARTSGDPKAVVPLLREVVGAVDPGIPLTQETTMEALMTASSGAERFRAFLVTGFGVLATLLAMVGVFGVTARNVAHRTRELGIRMALGARSGELIRRIALTTLRVGMGGILLGMAVASWAARFMTAFLFGTRPWEGETYGGAALLLALLCAGSAALAARRVTRVEPMRVLREE